jgi:CheY-like chemotaxis protein
VTADYPSRFCIFRDARGDFAFAFRIDDESESCDAAAERRRTSLENPLLILLADDEPLIRRTIVAILRGEAYDVVAVKDGAEAVECARKIQPDVFLADVAMPRMNGIEAARQIKNFLPNTRVICFSGHAGTPELLTKLRAEGYNFDFLSKPIKPETLIQAIKGKSYI